MHFRLDGKSLWPDLDEKLIPLALDAELARQTNTMGGIANFVTVGRFVVGDVQNLSIVDNGIEGDIEWRNRIEFTDTRY